jgi:hypothetical protein
MARPGRCGESADRGVDDAHPVEDDARIVYFVGAQAPGAPLVGHADVIRLGGVGEREILIDAEEIARQVAQLHVERGGRGGAGGTGEGEQGGEQAAHMAEWDAEHAAPLDGGLGPVVHHRHLLSPWDRAQGISGAASFTWMLVPAGNGAAHVATALPPFTPATLTATLLTVTTPAAEAAMLRVTVAVAPC